MNPYLALGIAIVAEVIATTLLKLSDGFTKPLYTAGTLLGYGVAFYMLSQTLRTLPTAVAYAIWSGVGIVLVSVVGWVFLRQRLDGPALIGMAMIVGGVLVINLLSRSTAH